jgi:hypothetical protein
MNYQPLVIYTIVASIFLKDLLIFFKLSSKLNKIIQATQCRNGAFQYEKVI